MQSCQAGEERPGHYFSLDDQCTFSVIVQTIGLSAIRSLVNLNREWALMKPFSFWLSNKKERQGNKLKLKVIV